VIVTVSFEIPPQSPLLMLHWKTFTPTAKPLIREVGLVGFTMLPAPEIKTHSPVAGATGKFPSIAAMLVGKHKS